MKTVVLIPFRGDASWRSDAFQRVFAQARMLDWPIYAGDSHDQPFSIGRTWNMLADWADVDGHWDIAVRWAADMLIEDLDSVRKAVEQVNHYTLPFDRVTRLTRGETWHYYKNGHLPPIRDDALAYGGITVITRDLWEQVGGFDPRFQGYGAEDYAFVHGVKLLFGERERVSGRQIMLWHPAARRDRAAKSDDPYWQQRDKNLAMFEREIASIKTRAEWRRYLQARNEGIGK